MDAEDATELRHRFHEAIHLESKNSIRNGGSQPYATSESRAPWRPSMCSFTLITKLVEEKKEIELQKAAMSSAADLPLLEKNMEEAPPPSWSSLGDFHHGMNAIFALLFGLKYTTGMEKLITLLVVVLLFYYGLMYAAKKLKADPDLKDLGAFTNNFSILFGILALILELLIVVLSYGSVPFFLWTILTVSVVVAVALLLRLAFVELKEELKWILDRLMEYVTRLYRGIVALLKLIKSDHRTEHKAQDQNQMMEHKAQDQNQKIELSPV